MVYMQDYIILNLNYKISVKQNDIKVYQNVSHFSFFYAMIILGDNMKKKIKIFLIVSIISLVLTVGSVLVIVPYLYLKLI